MVVYSSIYQGEQFEHINMFSGMHGLTKMSMGMVFEILSKIPFEYTSCVRIGH
jgi:hypothetical protein